MTGEYSTGHSSSGARPFVSVIIPVYNDEERLATVLQALDRQTYPTERYEVIVVDNASEKSPEATTAGHARVQLVAEARPGSYAARNRGLEIAQGEVLAFTDADCLVPEGWIEAGVSALSAIGKPALIAGDIRLRFERPGRPNAAEVYDQVKGFNAESGAELGFAYTGNAFTVREVFDQVGGFNADLMSRGDFEWGQRVSQAEFPVVYSGEAFIEHPSRAELSEILMKERRLQGGRLKMMEERTWNQGKLDAGGAIKLPWWSKILPPVREIGKHIGDARLTNSWQRVRFAYVTTLVHYTRGFERVRLLLGGRAVRR